MNGDVLRAFFSPAPGLVALGEGLTLIGSGAIVVPHGVALGTVSANSSTVTWAEWLATTRVLPAGRWRVSVLFAGGYYPSTAAGGPEARVGAPFAGRTITAGAILNDRGAVVLAAATPEGSPVVSDGTTPTTFRVEYRRNAALTGTPNAESAAFVAICERVQ